MREKSGSIEGEGQRYALSGRLDPKFAAVWDAFAGNFARGEEGGANFALAIDGRMVVDLWGGFRDIAQTRPWEENTICNAMSVGKAMAATCLHMLIDRGQVDLDAPVARYWPEFAANGKEGLLVRWVLDHRCGLPFLTDDLWPGAIYDWEAMTKALAAQAPIWPPGTQPAYHIRTFGFLIGEIIRRVTGKHFGQFYRDEIAAPLGIDFQFGVDPDDFPRCAGFIARPEQTPQDPNSMFARAGRQWPVPLDYNAPEFRRAEVPSSNGHGNARATARFYSILANGGRFEGEQILSRAALDTARAEQYWAKEAVIGRNNRQALGFLLNSPQFPIGPGKDSFGQSGMGGAMGFCDPDRGLALGYVMNKMHGVSNIGPRIMRLIDAVYACV
jgi:CubicO group peptidase (beta-lactamase class C family)